VVSHAGGQGQHRNLLSRRPQAQDTDYALVEPGLGVCGRSHPYHGCAECDHAGGLHVHASGVSFVMQLLRRETRKIADASQLV